MKKQVSMLALLLASAFTFSSMSSFAQNAKMQTKEEFKSHFDEIHNALDKWKERAEANASTHPEFATEVKQLDQWAHDFWGKLNEWDNVAQDKKEEYKQKLQEHWDQLQAQHEKVQKMWEEIQASGEKKSNEQMKKDSDTKQKEQPQTKEQNTDTKQKNADTKEKDPKTKENNPK